MTWNFILDENISTYINILKSLKICASVQIKIKERVKKWPATGAKDWKRELKKKFFEEIFTAFLEDYVPIGSHIRLKI